MEKGRQEHIETNRSTRRVRVGYATRGFGPALVVGRDDGPDDGHDDAEHGLLTVGDAVVTLEIPRPDGTLATLAWDPAEVAYDPLVA